MERTEMSRHRRFRSGFTLTEVLLATGILALGLGMVGSVFPVAIDQTRQSQEMVSAALLARSVSAAIRLERSKLVDRYQKLVTRANPYPYPDCQDARLNDDLRVFWPSRFFYEKNQSYDDISAWDDGNYVARVWQTAPEKPGFDAARVAIVICRSDGEHQPPDPGILILNQWTSAASELRVPGAYVLARSPNQGHVYRVDSVKGEDGTIATRWANRSRHDVFPTWFLQHYAVAAFHTSLGY